jgi:hypothetical protein
MIARACPEQQTIREAREEAKKHSTWDVLFWIQQLFSTKQTRNVFAAACVLALLFARAWNVCVCVCVCVCMYAFESFSTTEPQSLVRPEFLWRNPVPAHVTSLGV